MQKRNLEKLLKKELEIINDQIDEKIIRGVSYSREAKRHKFIVSSLAEIRRRESMNWFGKAFRPLSFI